MLLNSNDALLINVGKNRSQMGAKGTDPWIPQCVDVTLRISSRENCRLLVNVNMDTFFQFSCYQEQKQD